MGQSCSCVQVVEAPPPPNEKQGERNISSCPDPMVYDMVRRTSQSRGQYHLLYKKGKSPNEIDVQPLVPSRLVLRKVKAEQQQSNHIYAIRSPDVEQARPTNRIATKKTEPDLNIDPYTPVQMGPKPKNQVNDWVSVSDELNIYICDTGLSSTECDMLVQITEQVCKGHYAAYTYAKQTLGCREFPELAHACWEPVHRATHAIWRQFPESRKYQLDDREPHIVKYDVTKKERQKLDMHTDKSEWTFLIALSDGCGLDYEGGGTYFEALDATVHVQRGHALIFPGKLRHCGQRITKGLRFLLVGFLVDKTSPTPTPSFLKDSPGGTSDAGVRGPNHHDNITTISSTD
mmetsp:Transcript_41439/g.58315  ORF Transcript_41439/g.58315 Transcript_41439/m.58315 type:complete len:346 (+) Transcript_41439:86-1123(+)|eukprot:CAMPEP_0202458808 /NCGR_PEP_ID=MMETSP1360-20130828/28390_1 /ASSEMBLY_ACC=CAM_ASM_000848 /TAXON_ID=515479 /ORGANISM="Licmophora paradoxa, Strain CCMP2313" /LENGTH=345 /DNA_ID=CAMNT_0049079539 /DNA_START=63 /DNA_END=1100 /DNA_ORIENTATION=-